ncbi:MAG: AAA family ATPase [Chitinivibrionales bacterium]|nr:AAA family ATPase [Chitinivibrionales bacterium]
MYKRMLALDMWQSDTLFLWGARQTGKSTLLRTLFPGARTYDLLLSDVYGRLTTNPAAVRQECEAAGLSGDTQRLPIIIDEVQKAPALLDEVHWLIENRGLRFILCGSSARKLKRGHANLLGGRAVRYELYPLAFPEIAEFDLERALNHGLLPRHYQSKNPRRLLSSYVGDYLREEIAAESLIRNLPTFSRFLEVAALTNGEILTYTKVASECGVSSPTVKEYYQITIDTLLGRLLPAYVRRAKRRQIRSPKFYFVDIGVTATLARRGVVRPRSELFGKAFEQFVVNEVFAYSHYSDKFFPVSYWKTASGAEIDLVLGEHQVAVEIKSSAQTRIRHLKGLRTFKEEFRPDKSLVVSLDPEPRRTEDGIDILPWRVFLERLWAGEIL